MTNSVSIWQKYTRLAERAFELQLELSSYVTEELSQLDTWDRRLDHLIALMSDARWASIMAASVPSTRKRMLLDLQLELERVRTGLLCIQHILHASTAQSSSSTPESFEWSTKQPTVIREASTSSKWEESLWNHSDDPRG